MEDPNLLMHLGQATVRALGLSTVAEMREASVNLLRVWWGLGGLATLWAIRRAAR